MTQISLSCFAVIQAWIPMTSSFVLSQIRTWRNLTFGAPRLQSECLVHTYAITCTAYMHFLGVTNIWPLWDWKESFPVKIQSKKHSLWAGEGVWYSFSFHARYGEYRWEYIGNHLQWKVNWYPGLPPVSAFLWKVASKSAHIKPEILPPTLGAAKYIPQPACVSANPRNKGIYRWTWFER